MKGEQSSCRQPKSCCQGEILEMRQGSNEAVNTNDVHAKLSHSMRQCMRVCAPVHPAGSTACRDDCGERSAGYDALWKIPDTKEKDKNGV